MIGRLKRVPLRDVWKHEALDFTTWLEANYDILSEELGIEMVSVEREKSAGAFSVDLVAEDDSGNTVVIENQLEASDHDHLGKLITYLTAMEAQTAIWIVARPRPEHVRAVTWLNESTSASFYLLKVEAVQIGESEPAPLLTLIVGPSDESREIGEAKREISERHVLRRRFWTELLEKARTRTPLHANTSPSDRSYINTYDVGKPGLELIYRARQHDAQVELYIKRRGREAETKAMFDRLYENREDIEREFGDSLIWERRSEAMSSKIAYVISGGGYRDEEKWPAIHDAMIDAMIRLERAMRPHINRLP